MATALLPNNMRIARQRRRVNRDDQQHSFQPGEPDFTAFELIPHIGA
jgi:hypothetical protein